MNKTIKEIINKYKEDGDFTYTEVTDSMIDSVCESLGVKLPEQYIAFLKEYGHGGIGGIETMGFGLDGSVVFEEMTLDYRQEELPEKYVVIENDDEWLYCLDSETGKIVSWDLSGYTQEEYDCFDDYLLDQMKEAIENL